MEKIPHIFANQPVVDLGAIRKMQIEAEAPVPEMHLAYMEMLDVVRKHLPLESIIPQEGGPDIVFKKDDKAFAYIGSFCRAWLREPGEMMMLANVDKVRETGLFDEPEGKAKKIRDQVEARIRKQPVEEGANRESLALTFSALTCILEDFFGLDGDKYPLDDRADDPGLEYPNKVEWEAMKAIYTDFQKFIDKFDATELGPKGD